MSLQVLPLVLLSVCPISLLRISLLRKLSRKLPYGHENLSTEIGRTGISCQCYCQRKCQCQRVNTSAWRCLSVSACQRQRVSASARQRVSASVCASVRMCIHVCVCVRMCARMCALARVLAHQLHRSTSHVLGGFSGMH